MRQIIAEGQAEGVIAPHLDPQLTSIAILALLNSLSQWFRPEGPRTLDDVKEVFTHLVIHGVSGGPGRPAHKPAVVVSCSDLTPQEAVRP